MTPSKKLLRTLVCLLIGLSITAPCAAQTPAEAARDRWVALVTSVQGGVYIQHAGKSQWETLKVAARCYPGDSIRVDENSRAALLFKNDSSLRVDQNSHLTFQPMEEQTILMRLFKGAACFFSRFPRSLKIFTPHMNGTVKGTEFVIRVDGDETQLTLFEGQVLAENEKGELLLVSGQSIVAKKGQAPVFVTVVRPRDAVQWALYYPAIQDFSPGDFPGEADWLVKSRVSVEAWRKGDHAGALGVLKEVRDERVEDTHYLLYRASLALSVGRIDDASAYLDRILKADPKSAGAVAFQSIIATAQNNKALAIDLANRAVTIDPQSSAARVALAHAQQARFDLNGAMAGMQEAVKLSPSDAYARARLAELWLAQGYLKHALEEAQRAVSINPHIARTQVVLGYAYLTQVKITESRAAFEMAIVLDSADPLPRLGLGLAKIRKGELEEGRQEIEIAASLDVNNALIRSYLGKAYYEEKRESLSATQFATAKQLDPMDPTPWFYDAILKQSVNRPIEALQDMQKSIELNDNRAVYRSRLLLDQDLAARSAGLGSIYSSLGFSQIALVEGWKGTNYDPADFSSHRLLADSYASQPRHQIARTSELLQAQLLQPININPVQPQHAEGNLRTFEGSGPSSLALNEFNPLFNRNRANLQASGVYGGNGILGEEVIVSGVYDWLSLSLGQYYYESDGFRVNNDQQKENYNVFLQANPYFKTSIQAEIRYSDNDYGDLPLRFDPNNFIDTLRRRERYRTARFGLHHNFEPGSDVLVSLIHRRYDGGVNFDIPDLSVRQSGKSDSYMGEAQYLFRADQFRAVAGAGYADVNAKDTTSLSMIIFPGFPPLDTTTDTDSDTHHTNVYLYTYTNFPRNVTWTLGASGDFYRQTTNDREQVNPKVGLTWNPLPSTTIRAAAFRTLTRTLIASQTIEPTQVAGFNQFYLYDANGADSRHYGLALDQKISNKFFGGAEISQREIDTPYEWITGTGDVLYLKAKWKEEVGRVYLYWALHPWFAVTGEYQYERFERDPQNPGEDDFTKAETHRFPLGINFFHPSGIAAGFKATYVDQSVDYSTSGASGPFIPGSDQFLVLDASLGYRLPKRYGLVMIEGKNLTNAGFRYQETDYANPRLYPSRMFIGKIIWNF